MKLYGLMITKEDHAVFGDWCRDQLELYDAVVCLDGSSGPQTSEIAAKHSKKLIYLHERNFSITDKTNHGLRRIVHQEIVRRFGTDNWIMCCHPDEFCYHDPRKVATKAEQEGFGMVAWYSPQFLPHPDDRPDWKQREERPVPERIRHYHWDFKGNGLPWIDHRLYRNSSKAAWDQSTHDRVLPHHVGTEAPFHPILRHFKVFTMDLEFYERQGPGTVFRKHWEGLKHRSGLPFPVERSEDLFVRSVPNYQRCSRFKGAFLESWNMGEEYRPDGNGPDAPTAAYDRARRLAEQGQVESARKMYAEVQKLASETRLKALVSNDLGALAAQAGEMTEARRLFQEAVAIDPKCESAVNNLTFLDDEGQSQPALGTVHSVAASSPKSDENSQAAAQRPTAVAALPEDGSKVAIVSFLFNWPSTGGGIVHTVELATFLMRAGYTVHHFYALFPAWGIGTVTQSVTFPSEALIFKDDEWNLSSIQEKFRRAVRSFAPDHVIITDSWNIKPHLAEAVRDFPFILRFQAMEGVCPLNNVRFLIENDQVVQCTNDMLSRPQTCLQCIQKREGQSGQLHQAERALSGVSDPEYHAKLLWALRQAEALLVVNPLQQAIMHPYNPRVRVVTAGMDPGRFPVTKKGNREERPKKALLFAGLVEEPIKGFPVLHEAGSHLWQQRRDFEVVATSDPVGQVDDFTRFVGWQSQEDLPQHLDHADVLIIPTIAQEALGRTAVEAMAAGKPVIASRLGGLPFTVVDEVTGLLFEPGNAMDLAAKISRLLDDPELRRRLGEAGRRRFEEHYSWEKIIELHYRPLLASRRLVSDQPDLSAKIEEPRKQNRRKKRKV